MRIKFEREGNVVKKSNFEREKSERKMAKRGQEWVKEKSNKWTRLKKKKWVKKKKTDNKWMKAK